MGRIEGDKMKPVDQTKLHNPPVVNGNCMNAAFASILEIDIEDIPHFEDMPEHGEGTKNKKSWFPALLDWLEGLGFHLLRWNEEVYLPSFFIANGTSPRGVKHSVVYKGTEMVHDPHPSRDGIEKITSVWALLPLNPAICMKEIK